MIMSTCSDEQFDLLPTVQLGFQFILLDETRYLGRQLFLALIQDELATYRRSATHLRIDK